MAKRDLRLLSVSVILMAGAIKFLPSLGFAPPSDSAAGLQQIATTPLAPPKPAIAPTLPVETVETVSLPDTRRLANIAPDPIVTQPTQDQTTGPTAPQAAPSNAPEPSAPPLNPLPDAMPIDLASVKELMRQRDFAGAAAMLQSPDLQDDPEAMYLLSNLHRKGQGVAQDLARAFTLVQTAAEAGHLEAQFSLGRMYLSGKGTEKNAALAQLWMARAAEHGHVGATEALVTLITQMTAPAPEPQLAEPDIQIAASEIAERMGLSPLFEAADRGETRALAKLIKEGIEIDARDAEGLTPLMHAAAAGHVEAMTALQQAGARTDASDRHDMTPMMHAAHNGQVNAMEALFAAGATGDGVNEQGLNLAEIALASGECGAAAFAVENMLDFVPEPSGQVLAAAIDECDQDDFIKLADAGVPLTFSDARGRNGLWYAAQLGKPEIARFYLENDADPDSKDVSGLSALLVAINGAQEQIAVDLIDRGADINGTTNSGNTPLMIATTRGLDRTALALIERGADVNHRNRDGFTALMLAAKYGRTALAETLIAHDADADLRNVKRERAADIAVAAGYQEIALLVN